MQGTSMIKMSLTAQHKAGEKCLNGASRSLCRVCRGKRKAQAYELGVQVVNFRHCR